MTEKIDHFGTGSDAGDNSFLSNFHEHDGWTVEHRYQAAKTDIAAEVAAILGADTPNAAKKLGRKATIRCTWEFEKVAVMLVLLRIKFSIPSLRQNLLDTGDAELIEGNWWGDTFWGQVEGKGMNMLGKLLMQVRAEIQAS